jgi:hypothetical protein
MSPDTQRRCTNMLEAVNTGESDDHPETAPHSHVLVGTALGVAMHRTGGLAPPLAHQVTNFFVIRSMATRATLHKRC